MFLLHGHYIGISILELNERWVTNHIYFDLAKIIIKTIIWEKEELLWVVHNVLYIFTVMYYNITWLCYICSHYYIPKNIQGMYTWLITNHNTTRSKQLTSHQLSIIHHIAFDITKKSRHNGEKNIKNSELASL